MPRRLTLSIVGVVRASVEVVDHSIVGQCVRGNIDELTSVRAVTGGDLQASAAPWTGDEDGLAMLELVEALEEMDTA
jgi:hypothetical protein